MKSLGQHVFDDELGTAIGVGGGAREIFPDRIVGEDLVAQFADGALSLGDVRAVRGAGLRLLAQHAGAANLGGFVCGDLSLALLVNRSLPDAALADHFQPHKADEDHCGE